MSKTPKTAPIPDYSGLAKEEAALSKVAANDQAHANRPTQIGTEGSVKWAQDPITGEWTQTSELNAPNQAVYDAQLRNDQLSADKAAEMLRTFNPDHGAIPEMGQVGQFNQQATDLFNQLAQPGLDRQVNSSRARAAAMGIPEFGSRAGDNMNQQLGDIVSRSGMMGAQAGIDQGNIMFNQQNALHNQGYQDIANQLRDITAMKGMGKPQGANPTFSPFAAAGLAGTPDLTGAAQATNKAQQDALNAKAAAKNAPLGTIASIAGTVLGGPIGGAIGRGLFSGGPPPVVDGGYSIGQGSAYGGNRAGL